MKTKTYIFDDGTEPTVMRCTGPCDQGDKPCPCPLACEAREDDAPVGIGSIVLMSVKAIIIVGVIAFVVGYFA